MQDQTRKISAAIVVAVVYVSVHLYFALVWMGFPTWLCAYWPWVCTTDRAHGAALLLPVVSFLIFFFLHVFDEKRNLGGLVGRSKHREPPDNHDFADSALTRQSIYSAIGIGAIIGLVSVEKLWGGDRGVAASCAVAALSTATLLAMVSVLCYAHSKRWKPENAHPIRRHLLDRAKIFDEFSWYVLMIGLVWALAIVHPGMAIVANLGYGAALYLYYFEFREVKVETKENQLWEKTVAAWQMAETARNAAEAQRQELEKQRHEAESARDSAENERARAEQERQAPKSAAGPGN